MRLNMIIHSMSSLHRLLAPLYRATPGNLAICTSCFQFQDRWRLYRQSCVLERKWRISCPARNLSRSSSSPWWHLKSQHVMRKKLAMSCYGPKRPFMLWALLHGMLWAQLHGMLWTQLHGMLWAQVHGMLWTETTMHFVAPMACELWCP